MELRIYEQCYGEGVKFRLRFDFWNAAILWLPWLDVFFSLGCGGRRWRMQDAKKEELNNKDLELGVEINNDLRLNNHDLIKKSGSLGSSPSAPFDPPLVVGMHGLHWDLVVVICIRGLFLLLKCQVWSATQTCVWFSVSVFSKKRKGKIKRETWVCRGLHAIQSNPELSDSKQQCEW